MVCLYSDAFKDRVLQGPKTRDLNEDELYTFIVYKLTHGRRNILHQMQTQQGPANLHKPNEIGGKSIVSTFVCPCMSGDLSEIQYNLYHDGAELNQEEEVIADNELAVNWFCKCGVQYMFSLRYPFGKKIHIGADMKVMSVEVLD